MALIPLATQGNYFHIYDFRVKEGCIDEFIKLFNEFDYSDINPMHKSPAQVKDGVLVQDTQDPQRFWLIAEWSDIEEHARIRKVLVEMKPKFVSLIEGGSFVPDYGKIVSSTPEHILNAAKAA
jgi:quinol monooxygenase YgiN